jgi:hypothetical protein
MIKFLLTFCLALSATACSNQTTSPASLDNSVTTYKPNLVIDCGFGIKSDAQGKCPGDSKSLGTVGK